MSRDVIGNTQNSTKQDDSTHAVTIKEQLYWRELELLKSYSLLAKTVALVSVPSQLLK
jgi:hypothetical protein